MFGARCLLQQAKGVTSICLVGPLFHLDLHTCLIRKTSQLTRILFASKFAKQGNRHFWFGILQPIISNRSHSFHTLSKTDKSSLPLDYALEIPAGVVPSHCSRLDRVVRKNKHDIEEIISKNFAKIDRFARTLWCSFEEMADLVRKDTRLVTSFNEDKVLRTIILLKQYGYNETEILSNPPAFCLSTITLESRLKEMKEVRCARLYVLKFGRKRFLKILKFYEKEKQVMKGFASRETFLAALFGCEEDDVLAKSVKFPHLSTYPVSRLNAAFQILIHWGYQPIDIWNDLFAVALPPQEMQHRLDRMNAVGLIHKDKVFPLLHLINRNQFEESVILWTEDQTALEGHPDLTAFLCARFHCDILEVEKMYRYCGTLRRSRPRRLKAILDILLDDLQIPSYFILMRPVILMYSIERLKYRQQILGAELISNPRTLVADLILSAKLFDKKYNLSSDHRYSS